MFKIKLTGYVLLRHTNKIEILMHSARLLPFRLQTCKAKLTVHNILHDHFFFCWWCFRRRRFEGEKLLQLVIKCTKIFKGRGANAGFCGPPLIHTCIYTYILNVHGLITVKPLYTSFFYGHFCVCGTRRFSCQNEPITAYYILRKLVQIHIFTIYLFFVVFNVILLCTL
jgi:hypothetical protein